MTDLQILNGCTCLVQYVHLSCPFCHLTCNDCQFNPLAWPYRMNPTYLSNSLNRTRDFSFIIKSL